MSAMWLATRATGEISLILLTCVTIMGIAVTKGWASSRWPESVVTLLHRNISLLSIVFLAVHIGTTVIDGYVKSIGWPQVFIPFTSSYKAPWLSLGVIAFDLILAIIITRLLRRRIPPSLWKGIHWTSYLLWALAILHALGTGTDKLLTQVVAGAMVVLVVMAVVGRFLTPHRSDDPVVSVPSRTETQR